jgi:hypothetical protein
MLHPMVKDFYAVIEKYYGKPIGPIRTRADGNDIIAAVTAAATLEREPPATTTAQFTSVCCP